MFMRIPVNVDEKSSNQVTFAKTSIDPNLFSEAVEVNVFSVRRAQKNNFITRVDMNTTKMQDLTRLKTCNTSVQR
jgi:hypothetical protein